MLRIEFVTDNDAFDGQDGFARGNECARILHTIAAKLEQSETGGAIFDYNGNKIGKWELLI